MSADPVLSGGRAVIARAPVVAVGAIAFDDSGRVLLVERGHPPAQGKWTIPGGRVELGETLRDACRREVQEETGLTVEPGPLVEVLDRVVRDRAGNIEFHYVIIDFLVDIRGGTLRAGDDATAARFVSEHDMATLPLTAGLAPVLQKARVLRR